MDRRRLLLTSLAGALAAPLGAGAQEAGKVYRIAWLTSGALASGSDYALRDAFHQFGYTEGRNLQIEFRSADGSPERLRALVVELLDSKIDVFLTFGTPATLAAKQATVTTPIVMVSTADPVGSGLVASLARPGGNVTGVSAAFGDISTKCVELLQAVVPGVKRIGFLGNVENPANKDITFKHIQRAAATRAVTVEFFSATRPDQIGAALTVMAQARIQGAIVSGDSVIRSRRHEITEFLARARVPAAYFGDDYVAAGGLMSYGPNHRDIGRQAAAYVDRIFKGARAADLPVEEPKKLDLVLNLGAAKALGLTIPPSLLARADRVIE